MKTGVRGGIARTYRVDTDQAPSPAGLEQCTELEREFRPFVKLRAEIVKEKGESALIAQSQVARSGTALGFKLDDLPNNAQDSEREAVKFGARRVADQFQAVTA